MKDLLPAAVLVALCALPQPAVSRDAPLENRTDIPIHWNKPEAPTLEVIQRAIIAGCAIRGWVCMAEKPGEIRAVLHVRRHMAESRVTFDTQKYSITYVDSKELRYNAAKNEIHRKYNLWVSNLVGDINRSIAAIP